jgi:hypothetical protein
MGLAGTFLPPKSRASEALQHVGSAIVAASSLPSKAGIKPLSQTDVTGEYAQRQMFHLANNPRVGNGPAHYHPGFTPSLPTSGALSPNTQDQPSLDVRENSRQSPVITLGSMRRRKTEERTSPSLSNIRPTNPTLGLYSSMQFPPPIPNREYSGYTTASSQFPGASSSQEYSGYAAASSQSPGASSSNARPSSNHPNRSDTRPPATSKGRSRS